MSATRRDEGSSGAKGIVLAAAGSVALVGALLMASRSANERDPVRPGAPTRRAAERPAADREPLASAPAKRSPWTTSRVVGTPEPPPPYRVEPAFPRLKFRNPVVLAKVPGLPRYFVGEQGGRILSFADDPQCDSAALALDVQQELLAPAIAGRPASPVDNQGVQGLEALYGLAFHPRFAENRFCYVCYVVRGEPGRQLPEGTRVSRFRVTDSDPPRLDPASEQVVITWLQGGHNGGCLAFGRDGCLYVSTGDGGFANPPDGLNSGQDVTNLLSSILRIDVDHPDDGRNYGVPNDNPLVDVPGARGEIWCYGLRNPWKMSFDRATGDLWVGDVGWELWELVYRVARGGNYGWSVVEGRQPVHPERKVGPTPILPPTIEIPHTDGVSITGGYVYRGRRFPELVGQYVFGDWETRRVWAASWDSAAGAAGPRRDLVDPSVRLVAFAEDDAGELLLVDYDAGTIHGLARNESAAAPAEFPRRLSETGLFASTADQRPSDGVHAFDVNVTQWADHAAAERWIAVPGDGVVKMLPQKVNVAGSMFQSSTTFPVGTVLAKTLSLDATRGDATTRRRVETQLLHFDGKFWRGYSYRWNDDQTDAELVGPLGGETTIEVRTPTSDGGFRVEPQTWRFSSRVECARCHNQWAEYALAFNLRQLNRTVERDGRATPQLAWFEQTGLLELPPAASRPSVSTTPVAATHAPDRDARFPHFDDPYDATLDVERRARAYLHVNCAHCHRTGGGGTAYIELQQELPPEGLKAIDVRPTQGTFDLADARIIAPGDPDRSTLYFRVSKTGSGRMPHVGSELVDEPGARLVHDWIRALPPRFDDALLVRKLRDLDEAAARETRDRGERRAQIAQRLANQRRERSAGGTPPDPSAPPAEMTEADRSEAAAEDERQAQRRAEERDAAYAATLEKLFESPSRALRLARELERGPFAADTQRRLLEIALRHPAPPMRDLFERFAPPDRRLKRLGASVRPEEILRLEGDVVRGAVLFANTSGVQCKNCHRIGRIGGLVGPDLSTIGKKYDRARLLEHILEPSKLIEPKYVSYVAQLTDGRVVQGLLVNRTSDGFVFRDVKDQEVRVAADEVESLAPQRQSLMPELLLRDLTPQQTADLLAYLAEQK